MGVPLRDGQRNARTEIVFRSLLPSGVHDPNQLVIVAMLFEEQRSRTRWIEMPRGFEGMPIICEVVLPLRKVGKGDLESIGQRYFVVFVLFGHGARCRDNVISLLLIAGLHRTDG